MTIESIKRGGVAVITGAASGIGFAAASHLASLGMKVCMADKNDQALAEASARIKAMGVHAGDILTVPTDVSQLADVQRLKSRVQDAFGGIGLLMNNAAIGTKGGPWSDYSVWKELLDVNLWGVINGLQTFVPDMVRQRGPSIIVNVGSKQGITTPPGNAAYAVAKAGVKVLTEQLAHELRQITDCQVTAHLLIPGFTFAGMTAPGEGTSNVKPAGAWTAAQVVEFMMRGLVAKDFYILCPDNQVTRDVDNRRIQWAADDLIKGRAALSRWHPDYSAAFDRFMAEP
jgi:NAD(P)-dependent dehydrogenase (short-subunit alcohol dehydrogenase family)